MLRIWDGILFGSSGNPHRQPQSRAPGPREPERREPELGALTDAERTRIRLDYFRGGVARCPHDEAILNVEDTTTMGQNTKSIYISCPLCGLSEELS